MSDVFQHTACSFVLRQHLENGYSRYTTISVRGPRGDGRLHCWTPPQVGDTIFLSANGDLSGSYRVIDRQWMHASWGSQIWPIGHSIEPGYGVSLDLLVELAGPGWYVNEEPTAET